MHFAIAHLTFDVLGRFNKQTWELFLNNTKNIYVTVSIRMVLVVWELFGFVLSILYTIWKHIYVSSTGRGALPFAGGKHHTPIFLELLRGIILPKQNFWSVKFISDETL